MNRPISLLGTAIALAACSTFAACGGGNTSADDTSGDDTGGAGGDVTGGTGGSSGGTSDAGKPVPKPEGGGSDVVLLKPTGACAKLTFEASKAVTQPIGSQTDTDVFTWQDASCLPRTTAMARDDRGYARQMSYQYDGKTRTVTGTGVNGWNGFGFIINHGMTDGPGTPGPTGYSALFVGDHHAIYQYQSNVGTCVAVTRQWLFATGRDHPLFAVTFDASQRAPGVGADTRTPYGDMAWDGDDNNGNTVVDGVGWGDHYKFTTTLAPLTLNSTWTYNQPNTVPYCVEWMVSPDSEMGLVQSQTYLQHDGGGYWLYGNWNKTSANQKRDTAQMGQMPIDWNWTYQLDQYELCFPNDAGCLDSTTGSHRVAWGTNYGAVGGVGASATTPAKPTYPAYGDAKQLSGHPYQSYSTFVVLGKHSTGTVLGQVKEIEVVQKTTITATVGTVVTDLPGGVGRTDLVKLEPVGYDARYATWNVQAAANKAAFSVTVAADALIDPIVVVQGFTAAAVPAITVDGVAAVADVDFFASIDKAGQRLWITFRPGWAGTHDITIG